jgi:hypothetical protein
MTDASACTLCWHENHEGDACMECDPDVESCHGPAPQPLPVEGQREALPPEKWRMSAYYYQFDRTGVDAIDKILSAVASAGKAYHHTEWWSEEGEYGPGEREPFTGTSCVEWIQNAANEAAALFAPPTPSVEGQRCGMCGFVASEPVLRVACPHHPGGTFEPTPSVESEGEAK